MAACPTPDRRDRSRPPGVLTAIAGTALFVWSCGTRSVRARSGPAFRRSDGASPGSSRSAACASPRAPPRGRCASSRRTRLAFADALSPPSICGDAVGNVTPLGPLASEPTKIACVRGRIPIAPALTALAIENVFYTLSVGAMIAAGAVALLVSVDLPVQLREVSQVAIGAIAVMFIVAAWVLWRRPAVVTTLLPVARVAGSRIDKLRAVEREVLTFVSRRRRAIVPLVALELSFHALGVIEKHLTLWLILGAPPPLVVVVHRRDGRSPDHRCVQVPALPGRRRRSRHRPGDEIARAWRSPAGVTVSIVRKARMGIWSLIGTVLLITARSGPSAVLSDPALTPNSSQSDS